MRSFADGEFRLRVYASFGRCCLTVFTYSFIYSSRVSTYWRKFPLSMTFSSPEGMDVFMRCRNFGSHDKTRSKSSPSLQPLLLPRSLYMKGVRHAASMRKELILTTIQINNSPERTAWKHANAAAPRCRPWLQLHFFRHLSAVRCGATGVV